MSHLEETLAAQMRLARLPLPTPEFRFHLTRRWRFDFAWPDQMLAVEVEGGTYVAGRHNRPAGMEKDAEKYNAAAMLGWRVLRFTTSMVNDGRALEAISEALA